MLAEMDELKVFGGHLCSDFTDVPRYHHARVGWNVNHLETRTEVLQWYLDLNDGGVVHTPTELKKVRQLLDAEYSKNWRYG